MDGNQVCWLKNVGVFYPRRTGLRRRKAFWALKDISIDVKRGETLGVVGRNGAGKSTLLRVLAGIFKPDCGQIITTKAVAILLSLPLQFRPFLSGRDNIILCSLLLGDSRATIGTKMERIISFSDLRGFIDEPVYSYSMGMKARLGFSIAFHADADILLVDELLGIGDQGFRDKTTHQMQERVRSDKTVVLTSHSDSAVRQLCDRVVWLEAGELIMEGPAANVMDHYQEIHIHKSLASQNNDDTPVIH